MPCASYQEGLCRTSGLRMFQPRTTGVTSHGGTFWAGGSSQGTPEPLRCEQGLKGSWRGRREGSCGWGWSLSQA